MSDDDAVLAQAYRWRAVGDPVALATVVGTWGSSPRPVGSVLAITSGQRFSGSVSGGCVEGAVIERAGAVMRSGQPELVDFGISDDQAWEVGLACGGKLDVLIERLPDSDAAAEIANRRPLARVVRLADGAWSLVSLNGAHGSLNLSPTAQDEARRLLQTGRSALIETEAGRCFVHSLAAPLRMLIIGAVHIAQALAPMAALAGFAVTVIDPRQAFATDTRFPGVTLCTDWPDDAMARLMPDSRTAIVTLTHDPKLDDPALLSVFHSPAYYIGALGSRRTHEKRVARLQESGATDAMLARIHSPIGLPLGGRRASEIAVSILAEAIAALHGADKRDAPPAKT